MHTDLITLNSSTFDRSYDDKIVIVSWINRIAMFKSLPSVLHQEIASKLGVKYYKEDDISKGLIIPTRS